MEMFRESKISIIGLYEYDSTIFDELVLPEGVDRDIIIPSICASSAELEVLYPNPIFMRKMIGVWSKSCLAAWERVSQALSAEYDPISNYDRREDWTDSGKQKATGGSKVAGFNVGELVESQRGDQESSGETVHSGRITGNIGVTTNQQMINEELALRRTTIYNYIVSQFIDRFCIPIY